MKRRRRRRLWRRRLSSSGLVVVLSTTAKEESKREKRKWWCEDDDEEDDFFLLPPFSSSSFSFSFSSSSRTPPRRRSSKQRNGRRIIKRRRRREFCGCGNGRNRASPACEIKGSGAITGETTEGAWRNQTFGTRWDAHERWRARKDAHRWETCWMRFANTTTTCVKNTTERNERWSGRRSREQR